MLCVDEDMALSCVEIMHLPCLNIRHFSFPNMSENSIVVLGPKSQNLFKVCREWLPGPQNHHKFLRSPLKVLPNMEGPEP